MISFRERPVVSGQGFWGRVIFGTKTSAKLMKIYFLPRSDLIETSQLLRVIEEFSGCEPFQYSVNYGNEVSASGLQKKLSNIRFPDLEYLTVNNKNGDLISTLGMPFASLPYYELMLVRPAEEGGGGMSERDVFLQLQENFSILYGYGRQLRSDYFPTTEKKIRRSLFGSLAIEITDSMLDWWKSPDQMKEGAVKGVYPANFWNAQALRAVSEQLTGFPPPMENAGHVYVLDDEQQKTIYEMNPSLRNYFHFTSS